MKFDNTITISIIIGLVATLPQIIVVIINSIHENKIQNNENYHLMKRKVLEQFIDTSIECFKAKDWNNNKEFLKSLYRVQLYFKSADKNFIATINKVIKDEKSDEFIQSSFFTVFVMLSSEIKKR